MVLNEKDENEEVEDYDEADDDLDEEDAMEGEAVTSEKKKSAEKPKQKTKKCTVLVELLQKHRRLKDKIDFLYIGFHIYKVPYLFSLSVSAP